MARVHVMYREPWGWGSVPTCHPTWESAQALADATTTLAGPAAAGRRTWHYSACDCDPADVARMERREAQDAERPTALEPAPPKTVDGQVTRVRPARRSPLAPDRDGVWPTVLRPAPTELIEGGR